MPVTCNNDRPIRSDGGIFFWRVGRRQGKPAGTEQPRAVNPGHFDLRLSMRYTAAWPA